MNDQIRKLAEQAGFQYIKDEGIGWAGNYNSSLPKFAELIVRECIQSIQNESMNSGDEWETGLRIAENAVREHFGVKL